ncbi:MAG TPA: quinone-interacting membrane-bound oxidoreductase complex subunit QmoC [bacterium]|nr:quinone-interacting membrane-bound oxidoreductase complex subunit QmoC [bacterium]
MADATLIQPDLEFKTAILGLDAHDLSVCYQCGTCTAVCPQSTADNPFPRKEMVWVQWGLRDRVLGNSSIWLCHQCGICNTYCPRDAKPANVMAALRDYSITHYAVPRFMGQALEQPRYLLLLFAIPAVIFLTILARLGHLTSLPAGRIVFSKLFPVEDIDAVFLTAIGLSLVGAVAGGLRYWRAMRASPPAGASRRDAPASEGASSSGGSPGRHVLSTILDILTHRKFRQCDEAPAGDRDTYKRHVPATHLAVFWGFLGLVVTTTSVGIGLYVFGYPTPWPVWHPVKILGDVSGAAVIGAASIFLWRRIVDGQKAGKSTYSDWLFLVILGATTLTGFLCQGLRLADLPTLAYPTYFVHLLLIFFLLVYIPYSKFAHLVYRTVAMLHAAPSSAALRRADRPLHPPGAM